MGYFLLLADLAELLTLSLEETKALVKTRGDSLLLLQSRAYVRPATVRAILEERGFSFIPQTLSVQMLKGGVGKTTLVLNLGLRAQMYGARVLYLDLDQQANLSFALGIEKPDAPVWVDLIEGKTDWADLVVSLSDGLDLVPSNLNNSVLDRVLLNGRKNIASAISQYISPIKKNYDLILIDTAPNLSAINTAAACASDTILLPVNPDPFSYLGLTKTLEELDAIRDDFNSDFKTQILFTRFDGRESMSQDFLQKCFEQHESQMMKAFIRTSAEVKNKLVAGQTIFSNKNNAKTDYDLVAREILGF